MAWLQQAEIRESNAALMPAGAGLAGPEGTGKPGPHPLGRHPERWCCEGPSHLDRAGHPVEEGLEDQGPNGGPPTTPGQQLFVAARQSADAHSANGSFLMSSIGIDLAIPHAPRQSMPVAAPPSTG